MKLRYIKRIVKEDFPLKVQEWIDTLLYPLNQNIEQFNQILAKNIALSDNILSSLKTIPVQGTSILTGNTTFNSNVITNSAYYQATISGVTYGVKANLSIQGPGIYPGTTITNVTGSTITLSRPCQYDQVGAEFLVGGNFPLSFPHGLKINPSVVLVVNVDDQNAAKMLQTRAFSPQWELNGSNITIQAIPGLQAGRSYNITFLIM